ncbi:hypothetical protein [Arthrobacter sp. ISL-28]|uniref:hypothetical protein n=1 Tax=Arthrobacter sp. ISL-28 TaxID=2819108 RepID=UPI001BECC1D6|nr:hypothetical protein [Arthrobacter sp. ISL-28]MBT2523271.1 hypothetical protein [Arthrobacter sp. ISL-28]
MSTRTPTAPESRTAWKVLSRAKFRALWVPLCEYTAARATEAPVEVRSPFSASEWTGLTTDERCAHLSSKVWVIVKEGMPPLPPAMKDPVPTRVEARLAREASTPRRPYQAPTRQPFQSGARGGLAPARHPYPAKANGQAPAWTPAPAPVWAYAETEAPAPAVVPAPALALRYVAACQVCDAEVWVATAKAKRVFCEDHTPRQTKARDDDYEY